MGNVHKLGVSLPCVNLGCQKMFNSSVSRDRHMKYCGVKKISIVEIIKGFTKGLPILRNLAHYKNNQCYPNEDAP